VFPRLFDRRVFWTFALTAMSAPFWIGCDGDTSAPGKGKSGTEKHDEHGEHDHSKPGHTHPEG
jgi:hypothetical protein